MVAEQRGPAQPRIVRRRAWDRAEPHTLESLANLAGLLVQLGCFEGAEPVLRDALAGRERHFGADNMTVAGTRMRLAECPARMGRYADAEPLMLQTDALVERLGTPERRAQCRRAVAEMYTEWDKVAPNEGRRAEAARRMAALESTP